MTPLYLNGISKPWSCELKGGINSIGRNPTNDFRVSDSSVSSFHCELEVTLDSVLVRDLGSTNGTFIEGEQVAEGMLKRGQVLKLGDAELRLEEQPIRISIPIDSTPREAAPIPRETGARFCINHPDAPATLKCGHCFKVYCDECVRVLKRAGGKSMIFCPDCSGVCEAIAGVVERARPRKQSLLGRLTQTIRIRLR
jgi:hypothetical protein